MKHTKNWEPLFRPSCFSTPILVKNETIEKNGYQNRLGDGMETKSTNIPISTFLKDYFGVQDTDS